MFVVRLLGHEWMHCWQEKQARFAGQEENCLCWEHGYARLRRQSEIGAIVEATSHSSDQLRGQERISGKVV